jgi:membrane-associated phospholipid phosphatase
MGGNGAPRRALLTLIAVGVFGLYILTNQLMMGRPAPTLETPLDRAIPLWVPAEWVYFSVYLFLFLPVVQVRHPRVFERCAYAFYALNLCSLAIFWTFPVRCDRPTFAIDSMVSWGLALNYFCDPPYNNFPSLHVANAVFAALVALALDPPFGAFALVLAGLISVSTLLVKEHYIADVVAGLFFGWAAFRLIVAPVVPAGAPREEVTFPRPLLLVLPGIYAAVLLGLAFAYHAGWQPFPWPLPGPALR